MDCSVFNASSYLPTRLIDIGSHAQDPRLTLTHDVEVTDPRYLALSHCWGTTMPQSATTTLATMAERLERIPLDSLPRTFVDFTRIARNLGVQYVWIDSMCIIQDSREDWEKEAAQMASVYSNAYCTIAASGSKNGNAGCRTDPEAVQHGPVTLELSKFDEDGNKTVEKM